MSGRAPWLLLGLAALPLVAAPVALTLRFAAGDAVTWRETLHGDGELVRGQGSQAQRAPLHAEASGERTWTVNRADADVFEISARSTRGEASLRLGDITFTENRPWRSFDLTASPRDELIDLLVLPDDGATDSEPLPIDLDFGELFALAQLGALPADEVEPGDGWRWPRQPDADTLFTLQGRVISVQGEGDQSVATLDSRVEAHLPARPIDDRISLAGDVTAQLRSVFELRRGRLRRASGPVTVALRFTRGAAGAEVATVRLNLDLVTERVDPSERAGR